VRHFLEGLRMLSYIFLSKQFDFSSVICSYLFFLFLSVFSPLQFDFPADALNQTFFSV